MNRTPPHQLLDEAVAAFRDTTGQTLHCEPPVGAPRAAVDAELVLARTGQRLLAMIKPTLNADNAGAVTAQLRRLAGAPDTLLVTDHVTPQIAEKLRTQDVQFLDTAGNAYLNTRELFILVTGRKPDRPLAQARAGRAFKQAGMKLVFALLTDKKLVNEPYRDLAKAAGIALGAVGDILGDLTDQGFLEERGKQDRALMDRDRLLDAWVEHYPRALRARHHLATFTTDTPQWWRRIDPGTANVTWGGEIAAAEYTGYLTPKDAIVYLDPQAMPAFLHTARLRKPRPGEAPDLQIDCYTPFWTGPFQRLAHPLIVYADLLATGDVRNTETAERLYEKYLD